MKISFCIPVFRAEKYVGRCVRSLMEQTMENDVEFIFVNDASPDNSILEIQRVVAEYPNRTEQVKFLHHSTNFGPSKSRYTALQEATGEYVLFVDSDDWVEKTLAEESYLFAKQNDFPDIVAMDYFEEQFQKTIYHQESLPIETDRLSFLYSDCLNNNHSWTLWNKLLNREFLLSYDIIEDEKKFCYGEDRFACVKMFYSQSSAACLHKAFYHYVWNTESITKNKTDFHLEQLALFWNKVEDFLSAKSVSEEQRDLIEKQKVYDKAYVMLAVRDNKDRRPFADLFREEEKRVGFSHLKGGAWLMSNLIHYHLFPLIAIYQIYINWRFK